MDNKITIVDENGNEVEMEILLTFHLDEFNKDYVAYYNPLQDEIEVFVDSYDEEKNLFAVETEEEWNSIEEVIDAFLEDQQ